MAEYGTKRKHSMLQICLVNSVSMAYSPATWTRAEIAQLPGPSGEAPCWQVLVEPVPECIMANMANELDDILSQTDCPVCGVNLNVSYKTLRLGRTIECTDCGETIRPIDDTPISKIQKMIDDIRLFKTDGYLATRNTKHGQCHGDRTLLARDPFNQRKS